MDGLKAINVYVIETEGGLVCIDGGWAIAVARRRFEASLRSIGYRPQDVTSFLVTHAHRDHYTQAAAIRSEFGRAVVSLGRGEQRSLELIRTAGPSSHQSHRGLRIAGASKLVEKWEALRDSAPRDTSVWSPPDIWLEDDHVIPVDGRALQAVSTPGHTQGHFVFVDPHAGLLFAGDHVLPTITPSIGFEASYSPMPLHNYLASLAKVRALPDLALLPAHGAPGMSSHSRVDELIAHHAERLARCLDAVAGGATSAHEVAHQLLWTRHEQAFDQLDTFNASLATLETLHHLDLLAHQQRLTKTFADGVAVYAIPEPALP
jgi:glyoxylase-like metal-dependent hydrolase (beta-lactamase superfamily II)